MRYIIIFISYSLYYIFTLFSNYMLVGIHLCIEDGGEWHEIHCLFAIIVEALHFGSSNDALHCLRIKIIFHFFQFFVSIQLHLEEDEVDGALIVLEYIRMCPLPVCITSPKITLYLY